MIDLNDLRVFKQVATLSSFSEASKTLDLPRSSVSRAVARLEESIGIRLLQRTTREVRLTTAGQALYDRSAGLIESLAEAVAFTSSLTGAPRGTLTISAGVGFGINVLGKQLPGFLRRYPEVDVSLDLSSRDAELVADRIDVAIRMGPLADSAMVATRLGSMNRYLCGSAAYLSQYATLGSPEDLADHTIIDMPSVSGRVRFWVLRRGEETVRLELTPRVAVNDALTIRTLIGEGAGVGVLSAYLCGSDILAGRLERVLPEWSMAPLEVSLVFPSNREMSPTVRAFVDYMKEMNPSGEGWQGDPLNNARLAEPS